MTRIHELFDMAMFLIHEKPIIPLIQKLTESAIQLHERNSRRRHWEALTPCSDNEDDVAFHDDTRLLPRSFLDQLCKHDDTLWKMYCSWPWDIKFRQVDMTISRLCCLRIDWQALEASSRDYPCWINAIVTQLCKPNNLCGRYRYGALHDGFGSGGGVDAWTCSIPGHFQNHDWIATGIWRLENIQSMATSCFSNTLSSKKKGGIENCL